MLAARGSSNDESSPPRERKQGRKGCRILDDTRLVSTRRHRAKAAPTPRSEAAAQVWRGLGRGSRARTPTTAPSRARRAAARRPEAEDPLDLSNWNDNPRTVDC